MPSTRRRFLGNSAVGLAGLVASPKARAVGQEPDAAQPPPGMPPAFGTGPVVGPEITPSTIAEAEKLTQVEYTAAERAQAAGNWRISMAPLCERRTGPRKVALEAALAPASRWDPVLPGVPAGPSRSRFVRGGSAMLQLPTRDEDVAFARLPLSRAGWSRAR